MVSSSYCPATAQFFVFVETWFASQVENIKHVITTHLMVFSLCRWYAQLSIAMHNSLKLRDRSTDARVRAVPDEVMICYSAHAYLTAMFPTS